MEEVAAEEAHQGRDVTKFEVVLQAAELLIHGQLEGLGLPTTQMVGPPLAAGPSQPSMAEVVQSPVVVAS